MNNNAGKKVYVGLSGGVDSAVSAALLVEAGFDVTGVFIEVWQPDWIECNWREDRRDAMRVAAHLGIPFEALDLREEYKKGVIDYMISEYKAGRTPNPDIMCNREVKFGAFWKWALAQGADYVATGHYAQNIVNTEENIFELTKSVDVHKDQSYFLWTLNQADLAHVLFPVGGLEKPEVRKLAEKFGLPNFDKKDSQGLCFIGKIDIKEFLGHYIESKSGNVLDEKGKVIGTHNGALFFTIGERHGFTITEKTPNDMPLYVISKDVEKNTITVGTKNTAENTTLNTIAETEKVKLSHTNWTRGIAPTIKSNIQARSRYRQELSDVQLVAPDTVEFATPQDSLTIGQSLVLYEGDVCLGGGIIEEVM